MFAPFYSNPLLNRLLPPSARQSQWVAAISMKPALRERPVNIEPATCWATIEWRGASANAASPPRVVVKGPRSASTLQKAAPPSAVVLAHVHPLLAASILGCSTTAIRDRSVDIEKEELCLTARDHLLERVLQLEGWLNHRIELLEQEGRHASGDMALPQWIAEQRFSASAWKASDGPQSQTLRRRCVRDWGLPPDLLCRLLKCRFAAAALVQVADERGCVHAIAKSHGYASGAHFSAECLNFMGMSAKRLLSRAQFLVRPVHMRDPHILPMHWSMP